MKSIALFALALFTGIAPPQEPSTAAPPQELEPVLLFEWWDSLAFPAVDEAPAVRVRYWGGESLGFLLSESQSQGQNSARVFLANLREVDAVEDAPGEGDGESATYERVDLAESVWNYLDDVRVGRRSQRDRFGLPDRAQLVHLARVCEQRGLDALVHPLLAQAGARREPYDRWSPADTPLSLRERVWGDLEHTLHLRAWVEASAEGRLEAFSSFARRFPESQHAAQARHFASVLERMAGDDGRIPPEQALSKLTGDALVDVLIERLRYLRGHGIQINGGPPSTFATEWGDPPNEADRLVALGDAAVPALIEACDDDTLTCIAYPGRADWNPAIKTVGDVAQDVLAKITGDQRPAGTAQWKVWWLRLHREGEALARIDAVLAANAEALDAARELARPYPTDALWPVELRVVKSGTDWTNVEERVPWIELYASIQHPRVAVFLAQQARAHGRLTHRAAAALALERSDPASALAAARRLVYHLPSEGHAAAQRAGGNLDSLVGAENRAARRLIDLLVERSAYDVLLDRFEKQRPHLRASIARTVAARTYGTGAAPVSSAVAVLRLALADTSPLEDRVEIESAGEASSPRVCDVAALTLHRCAPERFAFDAGEDSQLRDVRIAGIGIALDR